MFTIEGKFVKSVGQKRQKPTLVYTGTHALSTPGKVFAAEEHVHNLHNSSILKSDLLTRLVVRVYRNSLK